MKKYRIPKGETCSFFGVNRRSGVWQKHRIFWELFFSARKNQDAVFGILIGFLPLIADKRQQSDMTRSLDGFRQLSLMFCTCARHSAGQDLCAL